MVEIIEPKEGQLYKVVWYIEELESEGYGIGTYSLTVDLMDQTKYLDFKVDGEKIIYRFELYHILSIDEYNYDKKSKL